MQNFNRNLFANRRGQFMPLAMVVCLAVVIFLVGAVNVYRVAKAKIRAQNLADATALYLASTMTQSMNVVGDRNEWMNHLYASTGNSQQTQAGHDPCDRPNPDDTPPGLGCFISKKAGAYKFHAESSAKGYARLIHSINQIQMLFARSYDAFTGAETGAQSNQGAEVFVTNLRQAIPDFQDSNISVAVYNSRPGEQNADNLVNQGLARAAQNKNAQNQTAQIRGKVERIEYEIKSVDVTYKTRTSSKVASLKSLLDSGEEAGYVRIKPDPTKYLDPTNKTYGAGAIVGIRVPLLAWEASNVKAQSNAYVVTKSGNLDPSEDPNGSASPTYLIRLGKL